MKLKKPLFLIVSLLFLFAYSGASCQDIRNYTSYSRINPVKGNGESVSDFYRHIIEVSHGQAFVDWTDAWAWIFSSNYLYRFRKNIALGAGAGLQFDNTGLYPILSLNSILGNKSGGFAFGGDIKYIFTEIIEPSASRIWITGGLYYRNFFIKMMPTFLFGWPEEWYFESGYSLTFGK